MSEFTYEKNNSQEIYETFEWDNTWIEHAVDTDTPRVLYIGDSISCPTRRRATLDCGEKIYFDGFGTSKALDNPVFRESLKVFTRQIPRIDAIVFNNGLHGWHLDETQYGEYYESFVKFLIEEYKVPVFIVLTTYIKQERYERVKARNAKALAVAEKYSLPVIDLHKTSLENAHLIAADNIHFTDEGYLIFAREIIKSVEGLF